MTADARPFASRVAGAEADALDRFVAYCGEHAGMDRHQALAAWNELVYLRALKVDRVNRSFRVTHGAFLDRAVLRAAAGMDEKVES